MVEQVAARPGGSINDAPQSGMGVDEAVSAQRNGEVELAGGRPQQDYVAGLGNALASGETQRGRLWQPLPNSAEPQRITLRQMNRPPGPRQRHFEQADAIDAGRIAPVEAKPCAD